MYGTQVAVGVGVKVFVGDGDAVGVGVLVFVIVAVFVAVEVLVAVKVGVGVLVDVAVPDGEAHELSITSENALAEPVSPPPLSLMLMIQLPFALWPSNALSRLFGENEPVGNAAFESTPH